MAAKTILFGSETEVFGAQGDVNAIEELGRVRNEWTIDESFTERGFLILRFPNIAPKFQQITG